MYFNNLHYIDADDKHYTCVTFIIRLKLTVALLNTCIDTLCKENNYEVKTIFDLEKL